MSDVVALADQYWDYFRTTAQLWNIDRGDVGQIEQWEDLSPTGVAARVERLTDFALRAEELSVGEVADRAHSMLAAVSFSARATASTLAYALDLALVAGPFNFATFVSVLVPGYGLVTLRHGEGYITKLRSMPSFVDGWIAGLRDGVASGRIATARGVSATIAAFDALLDLDPADHPLASQSAPSEASEGEANAWRATYSARLPTPPNRPSPACELLCTTSCCRSPVQIEKPGYATSPTASTATGRCCGRRRRPDSPRKSFTSKAWSSSLCSMRNTALPVPPPSASLIQPRSENGFASTHRFVTRPPATSSRRSRDTRPGRGGSAEVVHPSSTCSVYRRRGQSRSDGLLHGTVA